MTSAAATPAGTDADRHRVATPGCGAGRVPRGRGGAVGQLAAPRAKSQVKSQARPRAEPQAEAVSTADELVAKAAATRPWRASSLPRLLDALVAEAASTAEALVEAASTADEVVAEAASTADEVVAEAASTADEAVAEVPVTVAEPLAERRAAPHRSPRLRWPNSWPNFESSLEPDLVPSLGQSLVSSIRRGLTAEPQCESQTWARSTASSYRAKSNESLRPALDSGQSFGKTSGWISHGSSAPRRLGRPRRATAPRSHLRARVRGVPRRVLRGPRRGLRLGLRRRLVVPPFGDERQLVPRRPDDGRRVVAMLLAAPQGEPLPAPRPLRALRSAEALERAQLHLAFFDSRWAAIRRTK